MKQFLLSLLTLLVLINTSCSSDDSSNNTATSPSEYILQEFTVKLEESNTQHIESSPYYNNTIVWDYNVPELITVKVNLLEHAISTSAIPTELVTLEWESNIDGHIATTTLGEDYKSSITPQLSQGLHTIRVKASINEINVFTETSFHVCNLITLNILPSNGLFPRLQWLPYNSSDFLAYNIYRDDVLINTISNSSTTSFDDQSLTSFVVRPVYKIEIRRNNTTPGYFGTKKKRTVLQEITENNTTFVKYFIPNPYTDYFIGEESYNTSYKLHKVNRLTCLSEATYNFPNVVEKRVSVDGRYLHMRRNNKMVVFDMLNFTSVEHDLPANFAVSSFAICADNSYLFYGTIPGTNLNKLKKSDPVDISNLTEINSEIGNYLHFVTYFQEGNYYIGRNYEHLIKFRIVNNEIVILQTFENSYNTESGSVFLISPDNQNIYYGKLKLDLNFNLIQTFPTSILAISPSSQYVATGEGIFDSSTAVQVYRFPMLAGNKANWVGFKSDSEFNISHWNLYAINLNN